jgi:hypothetical protein
VIVIECDRCGAREKAVTPSAIDVKTKPVSFYVRDEVMVKHIDLCPTCVKDVIGYITTPLPRAMGVRP